MLSTEWSEKEIAQLRALAAEGHTSSQIAKALGRTRNSVIGKCRRNSIQLKGPVPFAFRDLGTPAERKPPQIEPAKPKRQKAPQRRRAVLLDPIQTTAAVLPPLQALAGVPFFDLPPNGCRFGLWGNDRPDFRDKRFCGAPKLPGRPWCQDHALRVYAAVVVEEEPEADDAGLIDEAAE